MSDGTSLRQAWYSALNDAQSVFRRLLTSPSSPEWKRVPTPSENALTNAKGKARSSTPELSDVIIHRKMTKSEDTVYRIVLDVPVSDESMPLEAWKSVMTTPELRKEWDPAVENATLLEMLDPTTRIAKTNFTLGWPANPRDSVTISRTFNDATTVIDVATSLPRSPDEPAYLRPSPPYVRSNVRLFAWCIQHIASSSPDSQPEDPSPKKVVPARLRITCFWQHDLRSLWNFGSSSSLSQQLGSMVLGLFKTVVKRRSRVPLLKGYGNGVTIERIRFDINREQLSLEYAIIPEDDDHGVHSSDNLQGMDELHAIREHRRLTRTVEFSIPISEGWDVQFSTKASSDEVAQLPWSARALRGSSSVPSTSNGPTSEQEDVLLRVNHTRLLDDHSILKVRIIIERSASSGLRLNGIPQPIESIEERNPSSYFMSPQMLQDATSTADLSFHTASSTATGGSGLSVSSGSKTPLRPHMIRTLTDRSAAQEKSILSRVRRNYIYFSSLLQEPEAKWKRTTEARGVSVTQLDSIDPTLVVYKAEATFVGVGLWDLYAAIASPGARVYWDKQHEDAMLLEDVNELTELWHIKSRPAWPANARDSVLLKTVYKSPTTAHIFSFSADEPNLFPNIPLPEPNTIRTQVDLQGYAIEALSPTTTLLTLLEQSDPKGWANKASIPQQMVTTLAGIGEFAIKCGGPPVATRLAGAKATDVRYDHERGLFRFEYEASTSRRTSTAPETSPVSRPEVGDTGAVESTPIVECELRCDIDTWASSLDIVVDPPPQSISCLRRHRLSAGGGGLWLTLTHDAVLAGEDRLMAIVRKGPGRERGIVMVNGAKVTVDVEELPEHELKSLSKQKRVKPARIPLDQPPVMGVIRRRKMEWNGDGDSGSESSDPSLGPASNAKSAASPTSSTIWAGAVPKFPSPLGRYFMAAMEQAASTTQQAVAAISPPLSADGPSSSLSSLTSPMQYALDALSYVHGLYLRPSSEGWTLVSEKGLTMHRKVEPEVSPSIPVFKGEKVIEGVSAEEVAAVISSYDCRKRWDDRFVNAFVLETFPGECHTAFVVTKGGFPFRDRGFYLASILARGQRQGKREGEPPTAIMVVSSSYSPDNAASFTAAKYNPSDLPIGRMYVDGWILETLDPYTTENYAIPSTRCTRIVAADYAGSIPAAVNTMSNTALVKSILSVESYVKSIASLPFTRLPATGVLMVDKRPEACQELGGWSFRKRDENRALVQTRFTPDDQVYRSIVLLTIPAPAPARAASPDRTPQHSPDPSSSESVESLNVGRPHSQSLSSSSTATIRHRRVSSTLASGRSSSRERALRSTSSAFTIRGEVRQHTDLLVAEVLVDSKMYPDGYDVQLRSRIHNSDKAIPLFDSAERGEKFLPLTYTVHTLPSSPLHSSGLTTDHPPRHLLRLMLPTAQQQISTLLDPLTGETRAPPPKPQWYLDLNEKGAVVTIHIRPSDKGKKIPERVTIDGTPVRVESEKESLTSLGREELQDDRVGRMAVLTRHSNEDDELPVELQKPFGVAEHLLDPSAVSSAATDALESKESEEDNASSVGGEEAPGSHAPPSPATPKQPLPTHATGSGFLGFLNAYPNALLRFKSTSPSPSTAQSPTATSGDSLAVVGNKPEGRDSRAPPPFASAVASRSYPLSTLIVIALIAFLMGSLLRSLISPADFIYVVTDLGQAEEVTAGWREIKRLLEVKYIVGGWDFQIAVVRRH
ncbi:hypothetical protein BV25DRAFT_1918876 [Artomyces pyxidatus]|uniref:Uncharacterized protein n=1 Tax=Artomyces pyxidatus TaxID=48021 RepID=A0ACB8SSN2_9AGAM|nr:hypothetical protein BV25DRAFT_1918876 [Artomyces pyxidatus]